MLPSEITPPELIAAVLFGIAVLHTFSTGLFARLAHLQPRHAGLWHLLGEVEVVFGLWAFYNLLPGFQSVFNSIADAVSSVPVLKTLFGTSTGSSFMSAGLILALMITPIITSVTREVFQTVPVNDKSGALALGATRWEMIRGVVLPHSSGGVTGAVMLGLGRAMGETVAVALIIGARPDITLNLFGVGETMPAQIFRQLSEAGALLRSALIGLGVILFVLTIAVNMGARKAVVVVDRRVKGTA